MIGFLIPLKSEMDEFVPCLKAPKEEIIKGRTILRSSIGTKPIVAMLSGYGKIKTAASTQFLIDHFHCDRIFHMGSAGALRTEMKIGDFVIGSEIVEHDYHEFFRVKDYQHPISHSDPDLIKQVVEYAKGIQQRVHVGRMLSGNEDVVTSKRRDALVGKHGGLSVDWESAACASICSDCGVPVLVMRAISDYAYENTESEYDQNARSSVNALATFLVSFTEKFSG